MSATNEPGADQFEGHSLREVRPSAAHARRPASPRAALIATGRSPTRAADQLREPQEPLRHQFRMFDVVGT
jgi:hypothetical protein